jgi:hypothetical protein
MIRPHVVGGFTLRALVAVARCARWLAELIGDLDYVLHTAPIQHIRRDWRASRRARRLIDERLAAFRALSPEDQAGYVHPSSPWKPPGWSIERYREVQRRRDGAH